MYMAFVIHEDDEDYGDITDPAEGRDVKVVCTKAPGRMWASTEVRPRGKQSKLSDDSDKTQKWMDEIPDLDEMYTCKTDEELEKIVNDWLNGDEETGDGTEHHSSSSSSTTEETKKYKSLDDAFADLEDL